MTRVHRRGVQFDVVLRNNGTVWLAHLDGPYWRHHGIVCHWQRDATPRIVFVTLHDGIFPPHGDNSPPGTSRRLTRPEAIEAAVDRWVALNADELPPADPAAERTNNMTAATAEAPS